MSAPGPHGPLAVVAVGQTPPPHGGQALAIESFVTGSYEDIEISHVRMAFSAEMSDVGKPQARKVLHLLSVVVRILWRRLRTGARVLYYPPAGPDLVPVVRDLVILLATRWAFDATVFHFHAGGVSEVGPRLPRVLRPLYRTAYARPDLALQPSALNPPDGESFGARRTVVVPNGVPDHAGSRATAERDPGPPVILYAGVVRESKGILVLVDACQELARSGVEFELRVMGSFESPEFERRVRAAVAQAGIQDRTALLGTRTGEQKAACFATSDVFCYPTYFEAETFGLVVIEAMQFSLPVVGTDWRGVPSVVADGETGTLVPPRRADALAEALRTFLQDPALRRGMGNRGRELYLERFTEKTYRANMQEAFRPLVEAQSPAG